LDSVFPDLSSKRIYGYNPTYAIESNDEEIFHYENGSVNVSPDFVKMIHKFAPIKMTNDVVVTIGKWIHSKTGLKPRVIWIGLKEYNVEPHLNEDFDRLRARRLVHIADNYFNELIPKDVCDLICIKTSPNQTGLGEYILLVLMSYSMSETKLSEYIKNFVPVDLMVMINTNYHCKDED